MSTAKQRRARRNIGKAAKAAAKVAKQKKKR
jgi:hypothetical protein